MLNKHKGKIVGFIIGLVIPFWFWAVMVLVSWPTMHFDFNGFMQALGVTVLTVGCGVLGGWALDN